MKKPLDKGKNNSVIALNMRPLSYFRVKEWVYHLGFVYLGMIFVSESYLPPWPNIVIGACLSVLYLAGGYSYNKVCDKPGVSSKELLGSLVTHLLFCALAVITLGVYSILFILQILLNIFYSHPRTLWKRCHIFSIIFNGYTFGLLFLLGGLSVSQGVSVETVMITVMFGVVMSAYQVIHEISHLKADGRDYDERVIARRSAEGSMLVLFFMLLSVIFCLFNSGSVYFPLLNIFFGVLFMAAILRIKNREPADFEYLGKMRVKLRCLGIIYGACLIFCIKG